MNERNREFENFCEKILGTRPEIALNGQLNELIAQFGPYLKDTPPEPDLRRYWIFTDVTDVEERSEIHYILQKNTNPKINKASIFDGYSRTALRPTYLA